MIFVTVGTHPQQFDRLLKKIDELKGSGKITEEIFAQTGNSKYVAKNFEHKNFLADKEFEEMVKQSSLVISHAGAGAIITALKHKKGLVLVPRLKEFGEHNDSHQLDLAKFMQAKKKALAAININELEKKIRQAKTYKYSVKSNPSNMVIALNHFCEGKK